MAAVVGAELVAVGSAAAKEMVRHKEGAVAVAMVARGAMEALGVAMRAVGQEAVQGAAVMVV